MPRYVDYGAATGRHRVVRPPDKQQYIPYNMAQLGSQLAGGQQQNPFSDNYGLPQHLGGTSSAESNVLSMAGVPQAPDLGGGVDSQGNLHSRMSDAFGPGTLSGAMLRQTGAGAAVAELLGSKSPLQEFGKPNWSQLTGVGGRFYGRGTPLQWLAGGGASGNGSSRDSVRRFVGTLLPIGAATALVQLHEEIVKQFARDVAASAKKAVEEDAKDVEQYWGDFDELPDPMQWLYGGRAGGGSAGYYPTVTPSEGRGGGTLSGAQRYQLKAALEAMQQWAHTRRASGSGGGGGTSTAPERLFLRGMRHPYDWVAQRRPAG